MTEGSKQGRKSALLIGINEYSNSDMKDLRGCLSDVATTEGFLTEVAGIPSTSITKLISPPASPKDLPTFSKILSAFKTLADNAQLGDFIYIHYSGHGTRLPTQFGDLKGENVLFDECLVLPRSDGKLDHLRDVEIAFLLKQIVNKGATVTFVLDCCHSGGATRGPDEDDGVRGSDEIPHENFYDLNRTPIQSVDDLRDAWGLPPGDDDDDAGRGASVVQHWMTASKGINFLAACLPKQQAQEVPRGATVKRGLLTDCLASVVNQNGGADVLRQLSCDVVSNLVARTLKTHKQRDRSKKQDVVFGGQGDCRFFGIENVVRPAVVVTSVETSGRRKQLTVGLTAGVAHGVCEEDIFAIYPSDKPLNSVADYTAPLATCSVNAVESFTCKAEIVLDAANLNQVQVGCVAVSLRRILKDHALQPRGVWVSAADDSAEPLDPIVQEVRDCISPESSIVELQDAGEAFFKVLVQGDGNFTISFTPNQAKAEVEVTGEPEDVLSHLVHLTIFYNLFHLTKDNATQNIQGITVSKIGYLEKGAKLPQPQSFQLDHPSSPIAKLNPIPPGSINIFKGQTLGIEVRNKSRKDLYVEILDLEPSWQVNRIYPREGFDPILTPPNEGTRFFIEMSPSAEVPGAVQPDTFDRYSIILVSEVYLNKEGLKVLDVGCADGILLRDLQKQVTPSARLVGVDIMNSFMPPSPQVNISYQVYDVCEPPSGELNESFDLTHVRYVLPGCAKVGYQKAVDNLAATLTPGGWLQVQEMDLDYNRSEVGQATNDANQVFSGLFDQIGLGARFPSKLDKAFEAAGLVNVSIQNVDFPMGKRLGDDKAAHDSWEPFALTIPSVVETAKSLGADIPDPVYNNLAERFEKEVKEQGSLWRSFIIIGQKPE
ncbi:hypothetical protein CDV31_010314 [Fusarium ambrosium]|uniref:Peptidase C14 caspase domain-containing protein n=1 Tax=Fusarium ambrosium TaxID=131363 RepID=A0A428TP61_9HYPO|nr:hypothetical protein CDV31_010314 [Fusarium ambrosium]